MAQSLIPDGDDLRALALAVEAALGQVIRGKGEVIRRLVIAWLSGGHVLFEDIPGTGKTTLAKTLARLVDARFQRIQFTADLLPSDILGVSVFESREGAFRLHPGPIFTDILLADEINRASPRTQSALLEAMAEGQVTIDRQAHSLSPAFFVMATQNPIEYHGTYPLPEAQMDRFAMRLTLGHVSREDEIAILAAEGVVSSLERLSPLIQQAQVLALRARVRRIALAPAAAAYVVDLTRATREAEGVRLGAGTRAVLALAGAARAAAFLEGLDFVTPDHVQALAPAVLAHRLVLDSRAEFSGVGQSDVVATVLKTMPVPR